MTPKHAPYWTIAILLLGLLIFAPAPAGAAAPARRLGVGRMQCALISPDGTKVLTGGDLGAFILDAATGAVTRELLGHSKSVVGLAWSPDARRIATASNDGTARIWDAQTGATLLTLSGHSGPVLAVAFSPDGRRVLTGGADKTARLWDAANGRRLFTLSGHTLGITSVAIAPGGAELLTGSTDRTARLWSAADGSPLRTLTGHLNYVNSVAFSPDGLKLLTASQDSTALIWDKASGAQQTYLYGMPAAVKSAAFSPDGKTILTACSDTTLRLWDAASGAQLRVLGVHSQPLSGAMFSADGAQALSWSMTDQTARRWNVQTGDPLFVYFNHSDSISAVALSPDKRLALTGGVDQTVRLWDTATGQLVRAYPGMGGSIIHVDFSTDQSRVFGAGSNRHYVWWDLTSGAAVVNKYLNAMTGSDTQCMLSPDQKLLLLSKGSYAPSLIDLAAGLTSDVSPSNIGTAATMAAFNPDGNQMLIGYYDNSARIWSLTEKKYTRTLTGHAIAIDLVGFLDRGAKVFTKDVQGSGRIWEAATGKPLQTFMGLPTAKPLALSPDGNLLVSYDRIFDLRSGAQTQTLAAPALSTTAIGFSPDSQTMVTGNATGFALLWWLPAQNAAAPGWTKYR